MVNRVHTNRRIHTYIQLKQKGINKTFILPRLSTKYTELFLNAFKSSAASSIKKRNVKETRNKV